MTEQSGQSIQEDLSSLADRKGEDRSARLQLQLETLWSRLSEIRRQLHCSDKHYRNPSAVLHKSALKHAHPASAETSPQTARSAAAALVWLWLPLGQGE